MFSLLTPHPEIVPFSERTIASCDRCFCVPTIGQIVEGYSLIFPTRPMLNLSEVTSSEASDIVTMAGRVGRAVSQCYGPPLVFEQGATTVGDRVGCGVDRAHLHLVPFADLQQLAMVLDETFRLIAEHRSLADWLVTVKPAARPYMIVGRTGGPVYEYEYGTARESQAIRRRLAMLTPGRPEWDWRKAGNEERLWRTFANLKTAFIP